MNKMMMSASAIALLSSVLSFSGAAWAQGAAAPGKAASGKTEPAADEAPHKIALIDMAYVFKNYKKFEVLREDLKNEIGETENEAKARADQIQTLQKKMKALSEGSQEFTVAEQQFAKASAEFEAFRRAAQRDFLKKESQIYHTIYQEVTDTVAKYANYFHFTLVLRFNREELDSENAQKLIEGMNRQVVWHKPENDITDAVVKYLNQAYDRTTGATAAPATAPAAAPRSANAKPAAPR